MNKNKTQNKSHYKKGRHAELAGGALRTSASSTQTVLAWQQQRQALKTLNQVQGDFMTKTTRGFTLIELLVVVLIIGILAAVAVPQYQKAVIKAKLTRIDIIMNALFTSFDTYILENGIPSSSHSMDMEELDLGIKFNYYNSGEHSYYNEYGQWQMGISSFSAYVYFHGRDSMKNISIGIERRFPSNQLRLVDVPEKLLERKAVCQWWASRYGAGSIINGANPSYPAKTWCAEVGVQ